MDSEEFCEYCDWGQNGFNDCTSPEPKERYARREWCGWANIYGIQVITTKDWIRVDGKEISRGNIDGLQKAVEKARATTDTSRFRVPKESPIQKVIDSLPK